MKFPFEELPGTDGGNLRPAIPVKVEGLEGAPQLCLLDTGSLHNRFGAWVAEAAGIDLSATTPRRIALGGFVTEAREARVRLTIGEAAWDAPVWFCDPWPLGFQILGQEGFFRWFRVGLRAATYEIEVHPEP